MDTVIIFGISSQIGARLIDPLLRAGYRVVGVARRPSMATIVLDDYLDRIELATAGQAVERAGGPVAAVINLAYARAVRPNELYSQTRHLLAQVLDVARASRTTRLIHVSTAAVFGYELDGTPAPAPAPWRPGSPYEESKIHTEHVLADASLKAGHVLTIVRPCCVIGPEAHPWTADVAEHIYQRRPVAYSTGSGYSNATYVENLVDYLRYLVDRDPAELARFGPYHHIAEFADHSWSEIFEVLARAIGRPYLLADPPGTSGGLVREMAHTVVRRLYGGPLGGYARLALGRSERLARSEKLLAPLNRLRLPALVEGPGLSDWERQMCAITSLRVRFASHLMSGWQPPYAFEDACQAISKWAQDAGYRLGTPAGGFED